MSTFETNRRLSRLEATNSKIICALNILNGSTEPTQVQAVGSTAIDTLNSGATATLTVNHVLADEIRIVNVQSSAQTTTTITLTDTDGGVIVHTLYGGSYNVELGIDNFPIASIVVEEVDGTNTVVVINTLSKTI